MTVFLSPEWIDALGRAAGARAPGGGGPHDERVLVLEQVVVDDEGPDVVYHLRLSGAHLDVRPGPAPDATVRLTTDRATATAIARGERSAQAAFMSGAMRIGGDARALLRHADELAALDDLFASVRRDTTY